MIESIPITPQDTQELLMSDASTHTPSQPSVEHDSDPKERLEYLRGRLGTGEFDTEDAKELCGTLYGQVVDGLQTEAIGQGKEEPVMRLLQASAKDAQVQEAVIVPGSRSTMSKNNRMTLGQDMITAESTLLKGDFDFRHPDDRRLIEAAHVISHEVTHAVIHGAEKLVARDAGYSHADINRGFLVRHPEAGFTGNMDSDVKILHERFAEGGRIIAIRETMKTLGYDEPAIERYMELTAHTAKSRRFHKKGRTQSDVLHEVTPYKPVHQLVHPKSDSYFKIRGQLGYAMPLSPGQAVELLYDAATQQPAFDVNVERYFKDVKKAQAENPQGEVATYLRELQMNRKEDLQAQRKKGIAGAIGRLIGRS